MKKFTCPYCYGEHTVKTCEMRCSYNVRGTKDTCYKGIVKDAKGNIPDKYKESCMKCTHARKSLFCPVHGNEIPMDCTHTDGAPIALIGAKASGKSNYIAVLIREIRNKMPMPYSCTLNTTANQETVDTYRDVYEYPLTNKRVVDATNTMDVVPPLIYPLAFNKTKKNVLLTFYDTAGENLDKSDRMDVMNQYIPNSKGIILLLDPLQVPAIRDQLVGKMKLPAQNSDTSEILSRVVSIIRNIKNLKPNQNIDIPIALAFTKIDALEQFGIIGPGDCLARESEHITRGAYVLSEHESTKYEMEGILGQYVGNEVLAMLENFKSWAIFGLSALGSIPDDKNNITAGDIRPRRVLDPLLWILAERGFIKKVK